MSSGLTPELAARFGRIALGHVTREFPNKLDHVLLGPQDVKAPRELHPIFFGSYDWHSCVHGHWLLARISRRYPGLPVAAEVGDLLDAQFTAEKVAAELAYLMQPSARGFERPYGWGWALMLQGELLRHTSEAGRRWARTLTPLADAVQRRFEDYLPLATYPVRAGVHSNTAFALLLAHDYARASGRVEFASLCVETARRWYGSDVGCTAWEPSQDDFLSPALIEAALMHAVLPAGEFRAWLAAFLPQAGRGSPPQLFTPARVSDRTDGKIVHLDGLNLSRAWCWRRICAGLPDSDPLHTRVQDVIREHLASALDHLTGDYLGEHWLGSFALLALDPESD